MPPEAGLHGGGPFFATKKVTWLITAKTRDCHSDEENLTRCETEVPIERSVTELSKEAKMDAKASERSSQWRFEAPKWPKKSNFLSKSKCKNGGSPLFSLQRSYGPQRPRSSRRQRAERATWALPPALQFYFHLYFICILLVFLFVFYLYFICILFALLFVFYL